MDLQPKRRSPEVTKIIEELNSEFTGRNKNSPETILLTDKLNYIVNIVNNKVGEKCQKEIERLQQAATIEQTADGQVSVKKFPGKEEEADKAMIDFDNCQIQFTQYLSGITLLSQYSLYVLQKQTDLCMDECEISAKNDLKNCMRKCYTFTERNTMKAVEDLMGKQIDSVKDAVSKL